MAIYLDVPGTPGEATAKGFAGQIEVESIEFGFQDKSGQMPQSRKDQDVSGIHVSHVSIVKWPDASTSDFLDQLVNGELIDELTITLTKREKNKNKKVQEYVLNNAKVVMVRPMMSAEGGSRDYVDLSYSAIKWAMYAPTAEEKVAKRSGIDLTTVC